jgi:hypothetical protein
MILIEMSAIFCVECCMATMRAASGKWRAEDSCTRVWCYPLASSERRVASGVCGERRIAAHACDAMLWSCGGWRAEDSCTRVWRYALVVWRVAGGGGERRVWRAEDSFTRVWRYPLVVLEDGCLLLTVISTSIVCGVQRMVRTVYRHPRRVVVWGGWLFIVDCHLLCADVCHVCLTINTPIVYEHDCWTSFTVFWYRVGRCVDVRASAQSQV